MGGFNFHPFFKWQAKSLETGGFLWWLSVYHESSGATFLMFFSVHFWDQYCLFCSKVSFSCHPCFFANFVPKIFFRQCLATFRGCELLSWFFARNPMGKCCPFCDRVSFVHHSPISAKFAPKIFFRCVAKFFECEFLLHFPCFCGIQGGNSVHFVSGLLSTTVPRFFAKLASKFFQAMCGLHFWMQIGVFFVRFRLSSSSLLVSHPRIPMTYRAEAGRAYW